MIFNSACLFNNELPLDPIFLFLWNLSGCEQLQMPRSRSVSFQEKEKPKTELGFHGLPLVGRNAPGGSAAGTWMGLLWDPIILSSDLRLPFLPLSQGSTNHDVGQSRWPKEMGDQAKVELGPEQLIGVWAVKAFILC